jgi:hypothetical protein
LAVIADEVKPIGDPARSMPAGPSFDIDWSGTVADVLPAERLVIGPQAARSWAPAPAAVPAWQQRFVNELGASAERLQPNAGLRLHRPVTQEVSVKQSRM